MGLEPHTGTRPARFSKAVRRPDIRLAPVQWIHRDVKPGSSACHADIFPLDDEPVRRSHLAAATAAPHWRDRAPRAGVDAAAGQLAVACCARFRRSTGSPEYRPGSGGGDRFDEPGHCGRSFGMSIPRGARGGDFLLDADSDPVGFEPTVLHHVRVASVPLSTRSVGQAFSLTRSPRVRLESLDLRQSGRQESNLPGAAYQTAVKRRAQPGERLAVHVFVEQGEAMEVERVVVAPASAGIAAMQASSCASSRSSSSARGGSGDAPALAVGEPRRVEDRVGAGDVAARAASTKPSCAEDVRAAQDPELGEPGQVAELPGDGVDAGLAPARASRRRCGRACAPASSRGCRAVPRRGRRRRVGARHRSRAGDAAHAIIARWLDAVAARLHRLAGARRRQQRQLAHGVALAALSLRRSATVTCATPGADGPTPTC